MLPTAEAQSIASAAAVRNDLNLPIEDQVEVDSCKFTLAGNLVYRAWVGCQLIGQFHQHSDETWFINPTGLCDRRPFGSAELALAAIVNIWKHSRHHIAKVEKSAFATQSI